MKLAILDALQEIYWQDDNGYTDGEKFRDMLSPVLPEADFDIYYVTKNQFPTDINAYDGVVASGSAASVHDDLQWIHELKKLLKNLADQHKKIIGVCFSHQLIARIYGGDVGKNEQGWLIGNQELTLDSRFSWMKPATVNTFIHHFNLERVIRLPEIAKPFAHAELYDNFAYTINDNILCVQGHPEQSTKSVRNWLASTQSILSASELEKARADIGRGQPDNELWANWFAEFLRR